MLSDTGSHLARMTERKRRKARGGEGRGGAPGRAAGGRNSLLGSPLSTPPPFPPTGDTEQDLGGGPRHHTTHLLPSP
eukprot:3933361-Rhodomonas_salina.2